MTIVLNRIESESVSHSIVSLCNPVDCSPPNRISIIQSALSWSDNKNTEVPSVIKNQEQLWTCNGLRNSVRGLGPRQGWKSVYNVLMKGEFDTVKHSFYKSFFVSHEDLMS